MFELLVCDYNNVFISVLLPSMVPVALWRHLWYRSGGKRSGNGVQPHIPQRHRQEVWNAQVLDRAQDRAAHRSTGEDIHSQLHHFTMTQQVSINRFMKRVPDVVYPCFAVVSQLHILLCCLKKRIWCTVWECGACLSQALQIHCTNLNRQIVCCSDKVIWLCWGVWKCKYGYFPIELSKCICNFEMKATLLDCHTGMI